MVQRTDKKKKNNNKGFSLVELIVVIAIMAVLVAVLAPQFTKYIDQSRKSNDAATVSGIVTAAQVGIADTTNYNIPEATYTITVTNTNTGTKVEAVKNAAGATIEETKAEGEMTKAIEAACGDLSGLKITSGNWKYKNDTQVVVVVKYENGAVTVTYSNDFADYVKGTPITP